MGSLFYPENNFFRLNGLIDVYPGKLEELSVNEGYFDWSVIVIVFWS